ncbi:MAG: carbohydrate ABC transporter permease [Treponema sp.]|jgi:putative aldouronate transport system permease protein|nr:carbohydrate ABC transporter permease [Treponema sp.]
MNKTNQVLSGGGKIRQSPGETAFDILNYTVVTVFALLCVFPFVYVLAFSLTPYKDYLANPLRLIPEHPNLQAYIQMLGMSLLRTGYRNTIIITVCGTAINLFLLCITAYPLSKKRLKGRGLVMSLIIFTMFFGGGMIPNYALIRNLKLINTYWALILPGAISTYNLILMRNFVAAIPDSLEESAIIDGANEITVLFRIILPLCLPAIFTFLLFHAVGHWNAYFDSVLYISRRTLWPLMLVLRELVTEGGNMAREGLEFDPDRLAQPFTLQMAAIVITVLPILVVYPFIQRYFMKGMLLGSVKG